jgi:tetratricopeptide (TPR) repeat protein
MKRILNLILAVTVAVAAVSCSSIEKMAKLAENVTVECAPSPLEAVAGQINPLVAVTYPADYFHPKAILEVTPVIVYEGGEQVGETLVYQGEKVKNNYKVVPSDGATVKENLHFTFVPGMEKSYLELRGVARFKNRFVTLPSKKVADGVNTTYQLVEMDGTLPYKADDYMEIISQTAEGQILYNVNSADVRQKELKGQSIQNFLAALDEINANSRKTLKGTEVVAYASPEGGQSLNRKLSDKRAGTAEKAWNKVTKGHEAGDPEVKSVGQDWEGFKELVEASNIQDKDLILRVLSMYSDPAVRESEIKNMSEIYKELKGEVLPELRRARFIANVEYQNYTPEELQELVDANIDVLDEEALLRAAALIKDPAKKISIYKKAINKYDSDRARFNTGVAYLEQGKLAEAAAAFNKVGADDPDLKNAKGVIALRKGEYADAARLFAAAGNDASVANMGVIDILNGNYAKAAQELGNLDGACCNKGLAYILNGQLDKAQAAIKCQCPTANYLRAIIAARKGQVADAKAYLEKACKDPELAKRAATDIEFAGIL